MRARLIRWARRVLPRYGLALDTAANAARITQQRDQLFNVVLDRMDGPLRPDAVIGIVFSKDRPLQLDGLIQSYAALVDNRAPLTVLYKASDAAYGQAYREVAARAPADVTLQEEHRFRPDLLRIMEASDAEKLFFFTDDDVFIRTFDMAVLNNFDPREEIFSMRLGRNLSYCYTGGQVQPLPVLTDLGKGLVRWTWEDGRLDWRYPASVDGHVFSRRETLLMSLASDFNAPNTFETALASFSSLLMDRHGVCLDQSVMTNIPANKVQSEKNLNFAGDTSPEWLLNRWRAGYRMDWQRLTGLRNHSVHEDIELPLAAPA